MKAWYWSDIQVICEVTKVEGIASQINYQKLGKHHRNTNLQISARIKKANAYVANTEDDIDSNT